MASSTTIGSGAGGGAGASTGSAPSDMTPSQRRHMLRALHPDKGGSAAAFVAASGDHHAAVVDGKLLALPAVDPTHESRVPLAPDLERELSDQGRTLLVRALSGDADSAPSSASTTAAAVVAGGGAGGGAGAGATAGTASTAYSATGHSDTDAGFLAQQAVDGLHPEEESDADLSMRLTAEFDHCILHDLEVLHAQSGAIFKCHAVMATRYDTIGRLLADTSTCTTTAAGISRIIVPATLGLSRDALASALRDAYALDTGTTYLGVLSKNLPHHLARNLFDKTFTDCTVVTADGGSWLAHTCVLRAMSPYLAHLINLAAANKTQTPKLLLPLAT